MPRCCSSFIQSEVAWREALRPFTAPAIWIAPPNSSSFSVSVVLPASGWEMIAKVLRRLISLTISASFTDNFLARVHNSSQKKTLRFWSGHAWRRRYYSRPTSRPRRQTRHGDIAMNRKPLMLLTLAMLLPWAGLVQALDSGPYKVLRNQV